MITLILLVFLVFPVHAGMPPDIRDEVLPPGLRPVGTYSFAEEAVPDEATHVAMEIDRRQLRGAPDGVISFLLEISLDGGATWEPWPILAGASTIGEMPIGGKGNDVGSVKIKLQAGTGRMVRGQITVEQRGVITEAELVYSAE